MRTAARIWPVAAIVALGLLFSGCAAAKPHSDSEAPLPSGTKAPWSTSAPKPPLDPVALYADAQLKKMTLPHEVASLLMLHRPGTDGTALRAFVDQYGLGGLILMGDNVPANLDQLRAETAAISSNPELPVLIGMDQEGGDVRRIMSDTDPAAEQLRSMPPEAATSAFTNRSTLLERVGVSVNFGIIADVTADPNSFIYDRVLGTDPASSSARVAAAVTGENGRVLSTLKHFPGHGETEADSHLTIPNTPLSFADWQKRDEPSFSAGVAAGAQVVMFGHLVYSSVDSAPASLSSKWHAILRDQLGFTGVTITDDMLMLKNSGLPEYQDSTENAIRALAAGNTMLLYVLGANSSEDGIDVGTLISGIVKAVESGRLSRSQIDDDARKLLMVRRGLATANTAPAAG